MTTYGNQTLGAGELHFARVRPGTKIPAGFRYTGNSPDFSMSVQNQDLAHYTSDRGVRTQDKSISVEQTRSGKFNLDDIQIDNLALFFFGTAATVSQTSTTSAAVGETIPDVTPGLSYQLGITDAQPAGARGSTGLLVKVSTVTKTAGTDYVIDTDRGILTVLEGGTIAQDDDLTLTWDRLARSYHQVVAGGQPVEGALQYRAYNPEGEQIDYLMPYVKLVPNGDFALKASNAWQQLPFTVQILQLPGRSAIYANGQPYVAS